MKEAKPETEKTDNSGAAEPLVPVEPATMTPEQLEDLKTRAAKTDEYWDRLLRTTADFENFRKRATREKQEAVKYANEALIEKLVPVLDHFDMALAAASSASDDAAQWTPPAGSSTRTGTKPYRRRKPPKRRKGKSSSNSARDISCVTASCAPPESSWRNSPQPAQNESATGLNPASYLLSR